MVRRRDLEIEEEMRGTGGHVVSSGELLSEG